MSLAKRTKISLDESRMLVMGAQILLGFQYHVPFQEAFKDLPPFQKGIEIVVLAIVTLVIGLIVMPSARHRIVEKGEATPEINNFITRVSTATLLPFALAIGLDVALAGMQIAGTAGGIALGTVCGLAALALWYGPELKPNKENAMSRRSGKTPIDEKIQFILTEARVVLPGAQALLGFQLMICFTAAFAELEASAKLTHGAALAAIAIAIALLVAPVAYHRIVYAGEDAPEFYDIAGRFILAATLFLAAGLAIDMHVVVRKVSDDATLGTVLALATLAVLVSLWHLYPLWRRMHGDRHGRFNPAE